MEVCSKTACGFPFHHGHSRVPFGKIVRRRNGGLPGELQDRGLVLSEPCDAGSIGQILAAMVAVANREPLLRGDLAQRVAGEPGRRGPLAPGIRACGVFRLLMAGTGQARTWRRLSGGLLRKHPIGRSMIIFSVLIGSGISRFSAPCSHRRSTICLPSAARVKVHSLDIVGSSGLRGDAVISAPLSLSRARGRRRSRRTCGEMPGVPLSGEGAFHDTASAQGFNSFSIRPFLEHRRKPGTVWRKPPLRCFEPVRPAPACTVLSTASVQAGRSRGRLRHG